MGGDGQGDSEMEDLGENHTRVEEREDEEIPLR